MKLLELWGEDGVQAHLEGCKRNKNVYENLAREMMAAGYQRNSVQCRDKIKKLRQEYKRVKDHNNWTGRGRKTMKFMEKMDEILGHKPATKPEVVLDTSEEEITVLESSGEVQISTNDEEESLTSASSEVQTSDEKDGKAEKAEVKSENAEVKQERKKRKRPSIADFFEKAMEGVLKKVSKAQEESDVRFCEIEERRLKLDEQIMEMEERRWQESKDREERQRKEEREFQLKVSYTHNIVCFNVFLII